MPWKPSWPCGILRESITETMHQTRPRRTVCTPPTSGRPRSGAHDFTGATKPRLRIRTIPKWGGPPNSPGWVYEQLCLLYIWNISLPKIRFCIYKGCVIICNLFYMNILESPYCNRSWNFSESFVCIFIALTWRPWRLWPGDAETQPSIRHRPQLPSRQNRGHV